MDEGSEQRIVKEGEVGLRLGSSDGRGGWGEAGFGEGVAMAEAKETRMSSLSSSESEDGRSMSKETPGGGGGLWVFGEG